MKYKGRFGDYGGFYVPEVLIPVLEELEQAFYRFYEDEHFVAELAQLSKDYAGRPSPLYHAGRFSEYVGFKVYLKREDLLHGGAHKVNNTLGQGLLAKYMGKTKLIAETGALRFSFSPHDVCQIQHCQYASGTLDRGHH